LLAQSFFVASAIAAAALLQVLCAAVQQAQSKGSTGTSGQGVLLLLLPMPLLRGALVTTCNS
jgi:hypothetical protein